MDISARKATWFIEAIHCSIRMCNNTALKNTAMLLQLTRETARQNHHPSEWCFQAVTPSLLPPCYTAGSSLHGAHLWSTSLEDVLCPLQEPPLCCPSFSSSMSIEDYHANYVSLPSCQTGESLCFLTRTSLLCCQTFQRTSSSQSHETWYKVLWPHPHDTRAPVCTGIQFSILTFKALLKQAGKRVSQDTADSTYPSRQHLYLIFNIYF